MRDRAAKVAEAGCPALLLPPDAASATCGHAGICLATGCSALFDDSSMQDEAATDASAGCPALLRKFTSASTTEFHKNSNIWCASAIVAAFSHASWYLDRYRGFMQRATLAKNFRTEPLLICAFDIFLGCRARLPAFFLRSPCVVTRCSRGSVRGLFAPGVPPALSSRSGSLQQASPVSVSRLRFLPFPKPADALEWLSPRGVVRLPAQLRLASRQCERAAVSPGLRWHPAREKEKRSAK